ncbi:hypothetical protein [Ascidiimonas aurantiaca]|uniref:hypothetical protein n=1 Tax=Ascidiimonas aurantiaca TaxID=1685432 RepID=UPI0030EDE857
MKLYKIFRKTPFFLSASTWMKKEDQPVHSSKTSRKAVIIPALLMQYGSMRDKIKAVKHVGPYLKEIFTGMRSSARGVAHNPKTTVKKIDTATLKELEAYASELGISKLSYTKVHPDFIFKDFRILYDNAIILTMEMRREDMKNNPSEPATKEIMRTYAGLGTAVNKIAAFLRARGFSCQASPAMGGDIMTTPVAEVAGMGAVGKNGLLITPEFGPSLRLAAVFVNIDNLPLVTLEDNEHLWIRDFCEICNKCVRSCPGNAIYEKTKILDDGYPQFIDREKCAPHFSKNCSRCISSCPFFYGNYEEIKKRYEIQIAKETSEDLSNLN